MSPTDLIAILPLLVLTITAILLLLAITIHRNHIISFSIATALVASAHYASFFLALETLSLSLIALIAYLRGRDRPRETGINYVILSGVSSAFLLFGIAIPYAGLGTLSFTAVAHAPPAGAFLPTPSLLAGIALVLVGGPFAIEAVSVYLVAYAIMTLAAFAVITLLAAPDATRDADLIDDYRGLFWLRPRLSLAFAASLLSLAGIPLTLGFIARFYAVASSIDGRHGVLLGTLVAGSIIGLYYYLRIIVTMAAPVGESQSDERPLSSRGLQTLPPWTASRNSLGHAVLAALVLLLIGLGAYPTPLLTLIRAAASMVVR